MRQPTSMAVGVTVLLALSGGLAGSAAEPTRVAAPAAERIEAGKRSFHIHCASCHGEAAKGDGPVAKDLRIRPADLTALAKANGGVFPHDRAYRAIDGRDTVRGHGPGSMPVWGLSFQSRDRDSDQEAQAREQIRDLLAYLASIQER